MLLVVHRVLHGEEPAPRLPEQHEVAAVQVQRLADLLDLVDEPGEVPQRRLVGLIAPERAELVVVVVLDTGAGEPRVEAFVQLVGCPRTAVQEQHLQIRVGADPLGPDPERAARRFDRHHPRPTGDDVAWIPG